MSDFEQGLISFGLDCADRAQHIAGHDPGETSFKLDGTPVLRADLEIEELVEDRVRRYLPRDSVRGEEGGYEVENPQVIWVLDPIDGTRSRMLGVATAMFALAAVDPHDGSVIAAVARNLGTGDTYHATRSGISYKNELPISVSSRAASDTLIIGGTCSNARRLSLPSDTYYELTLGDDGDVMRRRVSVAPTIFKACQVAEGSLDGALYKGVHVHDVAVGDLIVRRALRPAMLTGGKVTDIKGVEQPYHQGQVNGCIFSNGDPDVHTLLVKELHDVTAR